MLHNYAHSRNADSRKLLCKMFEIKNTVLEAPMEAAVKLYYFHGFDNLAKPKPNSKV